MHFPCTHFKPSSMTGHVDESITNEELTNVRPCDARAHKLFRRTLPVNQIRIEVEVQNVYKLHALCGEHLSHL